MKTMIIKTLPGLVVLIAGTTVTTAQESPLGSPSASASRFETNYAAAVRAALPKVDAAALERLIAGVRTAAAAQKPLAVTNLRDLERVFGLRERAEADASGFIDAGEAVYQVDVDQQRVYLAFRNAEPRSVPRKDFAREAHRTLADKLGIPRQEVFFTDAREILSETDGHPEREKGVEGQIQAEGLVTTMLRAVGGILVEGSYARLSSLDSKRLDLVDVRWPLVRLSEAAIKGGLRTPREAIESVAKRVADDSKGQAVNVRMAVVLRPVEPDRKRRGIEFVPSLKIGVEPQSIRIKDGYRTDAGEVFYVDLVRGAPPFADVDEPDEAEPRVRPKG
jgi:hypothetical protein